MNLSASCIRRTTGAGKASHPSLSFPNPTPGTQLAFNVTKNTTRDKPEHLIRLPTHLRFSPGIELHEGSAPTDRCFRVHQRPALDNLAVLFMTGGDAMGEGQSPSVWHQRSRGQNKWDIPRDTATHHTCFKSRPHIEQATVDETRELKKGNKSPNETPRHNQRHEPKCLAERVKTCLRKSLSTTLDLVPQVDWCHAHPRNAPIMLNLAAIFALGARALTCSRQLSPQKNTCWKATGIYDHPSAGPRRMTSRASEHTTRTHLDPGGSKQCRLTLGIPP